jgi:hypothetical protein
MPPAQAGVASAVTTASRDGDHAGRGDARRHGGQYGRRHRARVCAGHTARLVDRGCSGLAVAALGYVTTTGLGAGYRPAHGGAARGTGRRDPATRASRPRSQPSGRVEGRSRWPRPSPGRPRSRAPARSRSCWLVASGARSRQPTPCSHGGFVTVSTSGAAASAAERTLDRSRSGSHLKPSRNLRPRTTASTRTSVRRRRTT